jgi:hypothetical protein
MMRCALSQEGSPASPLTEPEKRLILSELYELKSCREQAAAYIDFVGREKEQDAQEKANHELALELDRQAMALAQRERDLAQDKASFYEQAFRSLTKKTGVWCRVARILTLGISRCQ